MQGRYLPVRNIWVSENVYELYKDKGRFNNLLYPWLTCVLNYRYIYDLYFASVPDFGVQLPRYHYIIREFDIDDR